MEEKCLRFYLYDQFEISLRAVRRQGYRRVHHLGAV